MKHTVNVGIRKVGKNFQIALFENRKASDTLVNPMPLMDRELTPEELQTITDRLMSEWLPIREAADVAKAEQRYSEIQLLYAEANAALQAIASAVSTSRLSW